MQFEENNMTNTFENNITTPTPLDLDNHEIFSEKYSKNYIDILSDLIELFPLQTPEINRPYNDNHDLSMKIKNTFQQLRRVAYLRNRKQVLVMFFFLGQLIEENNLSTQWLLRSKITKYYRRVALRTFHLYENVGVEQILRSSQINVRKLLDLKQFEYEQLIEVMRFAGAQT